MKKKNVIFLVLDSVTYKNAFDSSNKTCPMPFLKKLMNKGITIDKMYSQAPYTEAALVSLQCGVNTLDSSGHMKRNANQHTMFDIYKENGYEVFSNAYQPAIYPSGQMPKIEHRYYNFPFWFSQLWDYRLKYFSEVYATDKLTSDEYNLLIDLLDDNFNACNEYLTALRDNDESVNMIAYSINIDGINTIIDKVKKENDRYRKNKIEYINIVLKEGKNHPLFQIQDYSEEHKIRNEEFKNNVIKKYKKLVKKVLRENFKYNVLNNRLSIAKIKSLTKQKDFHLLKKYFINYINAIYDKDLMRRIGEHYDQVKYLPSLNKMLYHFENWYDNRNDNRPFFSYIHAEDNHFPETFFSYDIEDENLIDDEMNQVKKYLSNIPKKYEGSLCYDLSLNYSDNCIKKFFSWLESKKLLDDTVVVITADHGYSYYYSPIRENFVINYYDETYHTPIVFYSKDLPKKITNKYFMTKDILPTMMELSGLKPDKTISGKSILKFPGRDYTYIEFMGGGCPHYFRRNIILGIRTEKYSLVYSINKDNFDSKKLISFYDLKKDPLENKNLAFTNTDNYDLSVENKIIYQRFFEIQKQISNHWYYN